MFEQDEAPFVGLGQEAGAEALDAFFAHTPRLAVAFSGGCDSSYLVAAARHAGVDVRAYLVRTAFQLPRGSDRQFMHPETAALLQTYLEWVRDDGIDAAFKKIKQDWRRTKSN